MTLPGPQPPPKLTAALSLLDLPVPLLDHTASLLQLPDRARLAACCRELRQQSSGWWGRLQLTLHSKQQGLRLQEWLWQKRPCVYALHLDSRAVRLPAELPSLELPILPIRTLEEVSIVHMQQSAILISLGGHTTVTRLALRSLPGFSTVYLRTICTLIQLQLLSLEHLDLQQLPEEVLMFTALRGLSLRWNGRLAGGLEHLAGLQHLTAVDLRQCGVRELVPAFATVTALRRLGLSGNAQLSAGLEHLAGLTALTSLYLSSCNLVSLPPAFSTLTALQRLDLAGNRALTSGLEHLAGLGHLSSLRLGGCSIDGLPGAFSTLTALQKLELNGNAQLASRDGWVHLRALRGLKRLDLRQCGLGEQLPEQVAGLPEACRVQL